MASEEAFGLDAFALDDLNALAQANIEGDAEVVHRKLTRLDAALNDMAERAARFYPLLGDLARTQKTSAEVFGAQGKSARAHA